MIVVRQCHATWSVLFVCSCVPKLQCSLECCKHCDSPTKMYTYVKTGSKCLPTMTCWKKKREKEKLPPEGKVGCKCHNSVRWKTPIWERFAYEKWGHEDFLCHIMSWKQARVHIWCGASIYIFLKPLTCRFKKKQESLDKASWQFQAQPSPSKSEWYVSRNVVIKYLD